MTCSNVGSALEPLNFFSQVISTDVDRKSTSTSMVSEARPVALPDELVAQLQVELEGRRDQAEDVDLAAQPEVAAQLAVVLAVVVSSRK